MHKKVAIAFIAVMAAALAAGPAAAQPHRGGGGARAGGGAPHAAFHGGGARMGGGGGARFAGNHWKGGGHPNGGRHFSRGFGPGFAAGVAIGGAPYWGGYGPYAYDDDYVYDGAYAAAPEYSGGDAQYCAQQFKSYDPASGTYLGYDGLRHPCP